VNASFEESCVRFREFLAGNGYSSEFARITSEDVLVGGRPLLYVKLPNPDRARDDARARFEEAMKKESGVSFKAVCETDHRTLCTVWAPRDDSEREYAMCSKTDLKMSVPAGASRMRGKEVQSRLLWFYLQLRYRANRAGKDLLFWG
jgi:hypothetical protein